MLEPTSLSMGTMACTIAGSAGLWPFSFLLRFSRFLRVAPGGAAAAPLSFEPCGSLRSESSSSSTAAPAVSCCTSCIPASKASIESAESAGPSNNTSTSSLWDEPTPDRATAPPGALRCGCGEGRSAAGGFTRAGRGSPALPTSSSP
eukprot:scaffold17265_cov101-Isochrysis_galbana.AAC.1